MNKIFFKNFFKFLFILLLLEAASFFVISLEEKIRMKNSFTNDLILGKKISKRNFDKNHNSASWNYENDGRFLSRYCEKKGVYPKFNLIISGSSTTYPLATVHSGKNSTWIDYLLKNKKLSKFCVNTYSIAFPGHNTNKELKALQYFLNNQDNLRDKKTILVSISGVNEIKKGKRKFNQSDDKSNFFPYTKKLIKKIIRFTRYYNDLNNLQNKNISALKRESEVFLSDKDIQQNVKSWRNSLEKMNKTLFENNIEFIQILSPTLGVQSDPIVVKEDILKIKNPIRASLFSNFFNNGYFLGINKLYAVLSKNCLEMKFCINGSKDNYLKILNSKVDFYSDYRHPNAEGNKIIAEYISVKILEKINNQ